MAWYQYLPLIALIITLRYFIIAGILFLIYYKWLRKRISYRKIQLRFPKNADYRREIVYSIITVVIFSLVVLFLFTPLVFFVIMLVYNVYGHLGWEIYPKSFSRHWLGRWINTSVNHNQHHQFFKGNYGLYFLWWDRWMGTIRDDYEAGFEAVHERKS